MTRDRESEPMFTRILTTLTIGAIAMYALDPDRGRRRRAIARDKARSFIASTRDAVGVTRRDLAHRVQGLRARARRLFQPASAPDDLQLIERVRARMGRLVSHPHAVQVGARDGCVTLSGPILTHEVAPLLTAVRGVWGVADVVDRLVSYDSADHVSSLQGSGDSRRARSTLAHEYWPPALRAAALLGGSLVALNGMQRRSLAGCALTAIGAGLAVRALANRPLNTLVERLLNDPGRNASDPTRNPHAKRDEATARRSRGGPSIYDLPIKETTSRSSLH